MRKLYFLYFLILAGMALTGFSCQFTHDNHGYPSKVSFKKEGGEIKLSGDLGMYAIDLYDDNGREYSTHDMTNDSCYVQYHWLTIKWKYTQPGITLYAEPNTGKKNRSIKLVGYYDPEYAEIEVSQKH